MKCSYHPGYQVPLPAGHPFPISKYPLLAKQLLAEGVLADADIIEPEAIDIDTLELVHTCGYLDKLQSSRLSTAEQRRLGLPWSEALWQRSRLASAGTLLAARAALSDGMAGNLAGGTHHAFADHGEGFCVLNDVAVAISKLRTEGTVEHAAIIDLDVHQGNGTAAIFAGTRTASALLPSAGASTLESSVQSAQQSSQPSSKIRSALPGKIRGAHAGEVFTISLHQHNNYPLWKPPSSIDVDLPDGIGDDDYLAWLDNALSSGLRQFEPELICYLAGADPYQEDQLGGLSLTIEGLKRRDELVYRVARARGIPVMVTFAGGYAQNVEDTVTIHCNTVIAAKEAFATGK